MEEETKHLRIKSKRSVASHAIQRESYKTDETFMRAVNRARDKEGKKPLSNVTLRALLKSHERERTAKRAAEGA
jgi:hypothetical protein